MKADPDAIHTHEVSVEIAAPAEQLYAMVSDITRMGEWSPEAVGGRWLDGGSSQVGDRFIGENATTERRWERECEVAEAVPGRAFTFVVGGVEANCTWWSYEFAPNGAGTTTVTERWWMVNKTPAMAAASAEVYEQRVNVLTPRMLRETLDALKGAAER